MPGLLTLKRFPQTERAGSEALKMHGIQTMLENLDGNESFRSSLLAKEESSCFELIFYSSGFF